MSEFSERWQTIRTAAELRRQNQRELGQNLAAQADSWFEQVKEFRAVTDELMILKVPSPRDRRFHRAYIAQIIAAGEELAILARIQNIPPNPQGITLEGIESELDLLYASLAGEHLVSNDQRESLLREVFHNGSEPQT